jgi:CheY-like chemotaxis protein
MKILVVDAHNASRELVATALRGTRHAVELFSGGEPVLKRAREPDVDVVIFGGMTQPATLDFARRLRSMPRPRRLFVLLVTGIVRQDELDLAFASGVDDFVRKPFFEDELRIRVEGAIRFGDVSSRSALRPAITPEAPPKLAVVTAFRSWIALPQLVAAEMAALIRAPFSVCATERPLPDAEPRVSLVTCTVPNQRAEIELRLAMDKASLVKISSALMQASPTEEMCDDVMGELASNAAGAFKRAALDDGAAFTLGLPELVGLGATSWQDGPAARAWTAECRALAAKVSFHATIRATEPCRIPTARLREGMVLSEDLMTTSGALIAAAGTRMTASYVERVERFLGRSFLVGVAVPSRLPDPGSLKERANA